MSAIDEGADFSRLMTQVLWEQECCVCDAGTDCPLRHCKYDDHSLAPPTFGYYTERLVMLRTCLEE
jgi:hypothetical protein